MRRCEVDRTKNHSRQISDVRVARRDVTILLFWLGLTLPGATGSDAATWIVDPGGNGDETTIQAAIDTAAAGDTVLVKAGVYDTTHAGSLGDLVVVEMKSGVVLRSEDGSSATLIDLTGAADPVRGIICNACDGSTIVEGFKVTGGDTYYGASIYISGGAPIIQDMEFNNAYGGTGGAMIINQGADPIVRNNRFTDNTACCGPGGAILIEGPAAPIIRSNSFENSLAFNGGAIAVQNASGLIEDNLFQNNFSTNGGAISLRNSNTEVIDNTIVGNHATTSGGGVYFLSCQDGLFARNLVADNIADGEGGALALDDSSPEIIENSCVNNTGFIGGGVYVTGNSSPLFERSLFVFNDGICQVYCLSHGSPVFECNDVFSPDGAAFLGSCGDPTGQAGNISENPLFCVGDPDQYVLQECSPCAPGELCQRIGARDIDCDCIDPVPVSSSSWGIIKLNFGGE
jgi:Right handed beta helix region